MSDVDFDTSAPVAEVEEEVVAEVAEAEAPKGKMSVEDALQVSSFHSGQGKEGADEGTYARTSSRRPSSTTVLRVDSASAPRLSTSARLTSAFSTSPALRPSTSSSSRLSAPSTSSLALFEKGRS